MATKKLKHGQTKLESGIEICTDKMIGCVINIISFMLLLPLMGIETTLKQTLTIGLIMTTISIVKSYSVRRLFNWLHKKKILRTFIRKTLLRQSEN